MHVNSSWLFEPMTPRLKNKATTRCGCQRPKVIKRPKVIHLEVIWVLQSLHSLSLLPFLTQGAIASLVDTFGMVPCKGVAKPQASYVNLLNKMNQLSNANHN